MREVEHLLARYKADFDAVLETHAGLSSLPRDAALTAALHKLWLGSDYAADLCLRHPELLAELLEQGELDREYDDHLRHLDTTLARWQEQGRLPANETERLHSFLRLYRKRQMLRILWRDINGKADLFQTCRDLSRLADACIQHALEQLTAHCTLRYGVPLDSRGRQQQLIVLAMGKYGADELNLSSDIDLIFVFPEDGETQVSDDMRKQFAGAQSCTIQQYFSKLGQLLINALDNFTSEGYVFRVDMRLRPYGDSGALALSIEAMEQYYQTQGRDWERFAMIKTRAVTGDASQVAYLTSMLGSFTYRRYIDFATIDSLRDLKRQIEQQVRRKKLHDNIKLGMGGIREIEFIVQVLQLIYGGRHKHLQQRSIIRAMDALVQENCLPAEDVAQLKECYRFLRRLEHAVQGLQDKQTHDYPSQPAHEYRVAGVLGFASVETLKAKTAEVRNTVAELFKGVIALPEESEQVSKDDDMEQLWQALPDPDKGEQLLSARGFTEPAAVMKELQAFRESKQYLSLDAVSRQRMDRFMPKLLAAASAEEDPDLGFRRVFEFVQAIARRTVYLVLLMENPLALSQLVMLCAASPWVVALLSRYPALLDELLSPLSEPPDRQRLAGKLQQALLRVPPDDVGEQLHAIQNFKQEQVLLVAAAELSGTLPLMKVSDYLTWVAEAVLGQIVGIAWRGLVTKYGHPANAAGETGSMDFIVIGYGKLGGIELNYGSDLDLVFMHDGHDELDTSGGEEGAKINSGAFYVQLGQKVLSMLNTHTVTGRLYEIDLRLRPSGNSGALVCNSTGFERYQVDNAWTWEHQALVRTRVVAGSAELGRSFEQIRNKVLGQERDTGHLAREIVSMREKMRRQLGSRPGEEVFQLKHDPGGLVDIEFIVQYLVLAFASRYPQLLQWSDNMRLLDEIAASGVLPEADALALQQIYIEYRSLLHKRALDNKDYRLPGTAFREQRAVITRIWQDLFKGIEPGELAGAAGNKT